MRKLALSCSVVDVERHAEIGDFVQVEGASIFDLGVVGEMFR